MSNNTRFLSRLLGLYCLIAACAMLWQRHATVEMVAALVQDRPLLFMVGVLTVFGGLAMVLVHNVWSRGGVTLIVTVVAWLTLIKGLMFLFLPPGAAGAFYLGTLHYAQMFYWYAGIAALLGLYLTFEGFKS